MAPFSGPKLAPSAPRSRSALQSVWSTVSPDSNAWAAGGKQQPRSAATAFPGNYDNIAAYGGHIQTASSSLFSTVSSSPKRTNVWCASCLRYRWHRAAQSTRIEAPSHTCRVTRSAQRSAVAEMGPETCCSLCGRAYRRRGSPKYRRGARLAGAARGASWPPTPGQSTGPPRMKFDPDRCRDG